MVLPLEPFFSSHPAQHAFSWKTPFKKELSRSFPDFQLRCASDGSLLGKNSGDASFLYISKLTTTPAQVPFESEMESAKTTGIFGQWLRKNKETIRLRKTTY